jgi:hypothetical protein
MVAGAGRLLATTPVGEEAVDGFEHHAVVRCAASGRGAVQVAAAVPEQIAGAADPVGGDQ